MTDTIRGISSYDINNRAAANRTLGLDEHATLDDLFKSVIKGGTVDMNQKQWWAYGRKFLSDEVTHTPPPPSAESVAHK